LAAAATIYSSLSTSSQLNAGMHVGRKEGKKEGASERACVPHAWGDDDVAAVRALEERNSELALE
jgi:hypothetical protein